MPKRSKEYAYFCSTPCPKIVPNLLDLKCKGEGLGSVNGVPTSEHDGKIWKTCWPRLVGSFHLGMPSGLQGILPSYCSLRFPVGFLGCPYLSPADVSFLQSTICSVPSRPILWRSKSDHGMSSAQTTSQSPRHPLPLYPPAILNDLQLLFSICPCALCEQTSN